MELQAEKLLVILANLYIENVLLKERVGQLEAEIKGIASIRKEDQSHG